MSISLDELDRKRKRSNHLKEIGADIKVPMLGGKPATKKAKKGDGGIGGFLGHLAKQTGADLYHSAVNLPAGVYTVAKETELDQIDAIRRGDVTGASPFGVLLKGKRTRKLEKGQLESVKQDVTHPLRHPGYTGLDLLSAVSGGVGAAAKVGAAGRVLSEGGTLAEAARAARALRPAQRTLRSGGLEVHPETSRSFLSAAVQRRRDALLQGAAERNPAGRAAGLLERKVGKVVTARAKQAERIARGPGEAVIKMGRKLTAGQQKALQVVAEQAPIDQRITAASARVTGARDAAARARHANELDLLHQAKEHLAGGEGAPQLVEPKLRKIFDRMSTVAGDRETLLKGLGQLTNEAIGSRKTRAARVSLGASYEAPTPGKLGLPSDTLKKARSRVGSLQARFDKLSAGEPGHGYHDTSRPRTEAEARRRLAQLEAKHGKFEQQIYDRLFTEKLTPEERASQNYRNIENGRARRQASGKTRAGKASGASGRKSVERGLVRDDRWKQVEAEIQKAIDRAGDHPSAKRLQAERDEMHRLRTALETQPEEAFGPRAPRTAEQLGTVTGSVYRGPARPRLERLGGALSIAKDELQKLEGQAGGRVAKTGIGTARSRFEAKLAAAPAKLVSAYERKFKNIVSTDAARELSPEYAQSKTSRSLLAAEVHEPSSRLAKLVYARKLARKPARDRTVTLMGGGTGAGKSTILAGHGGVKSADIVYDTNLNNVASSVAKIDQAIASGRNVKILYVYRNPAEALVHGALPRAERMGRTVPLAEHIKTHVGSNAAIRELAKRYANDPRVNIEIVANTAGKGGAQVIPLAQLPKLVHNEVRDEVTRAYEAERAAGRVSAAVHEGTAGQEAAGSVGPGRGGSAGPGSSDRQVRGLLADEFTPSSEAVRIPDVALANRSARRALGSVGSAGTIGKLRPLGSTSHEYTGVLRENALRRQDTTRLVGESSLEAAKYAGLRHVHDLVRQAVQPHPTRPDDVAVRLDEIGTAEKLPLDVRKFISDPEEFFTKETPAEQASMLDKVRSELFIDPRKLTPEARARFAQLEQDGKVGWVPRRILGEFAKPQAPLSSVVGSKPVRTFDAINNASRFAILYLKPAYALPNLLGNAALNVLQQGFAAVPNVARAAKLNSRLGEDVTARIDAAMGEGVAQAISAHGAGRLSGVVDKAAQVWSKGVDTPFRRSSFLYEAKRAGFGTPAKLERLVLDPSLHETFIDVGLRANREIIDYANLTPVEREVIRRVVFFYPWIKGSTVYAGRMVREHPIKTAAEAHLGAIGQQESQGKLGPIPSYLEGLIPAGASSVINPNSAAILQTPAVLGLTAQGILTGNLPEVAQASNYYTPALALAAALATRTNPRTGQAYPNGTGAGAISRDVLAGSLPQVSLARNLNAAVTGKGGSKLYPPSVRSALLQFLVGGLAPRKIDMNDLHRLAALEKKPRR